MNGGISIHCVDVANGRVAVGLGVSVHRLGGGELIAQGAVNAQGLFEHPALMSEAITAGGYDVRFAVGDFYRKLGGTPGAPIAPSAFLELVPYHFHIVDATKHTHLPFKFTPWGFSLFRGGA